MTTRSTQHIPITDFKRDFPADYEAFLQSREDVPTWIDQVVAFDVTFRDGKVTNVIAYDQDDEDEANMHEYRKNCSCANCEERRLGVVLEED